VITFGKAVQERHCGCATPSFNHCRTFSLFPELGRKQEEEGVRKIVTRRYSYRVYYMADEAADEIIVVAIRHPARRPEHSNA
jgi:plasmid stabilization system protein ParE